MNWVGGEEAVCWVDCGDGCSSADGPMAMECNWGVQLLQWDYSLVSWIVRERKQQQWMDEWMGRLIRTGPRR